MRWTTVNRMPAEVEVRRERLRQLEDEPSVLLLLREGFDEAADAQLPADARDELHRLEGLADEIVGPGLEDPRNLLVAFERGEHDDGQIARLRAAPQDAQDLVAVRRRHHEVEQHDRRLHSLDLLESLRARADGNMREVRICEGLDQYMSTNGIVVDDEDGATRHYKSVPAAFTRGQRIESFLPTMALHRC